MAGSRAIRRLHVGLVIYHCAAAVMFAVLSGVWREDRSDVTFAGEFQFNFRLLTAVAINEALLSVYHLIRSFDDMFSAQQLLLARVIMESSSLTIISLIIQYTCGVSDLLLGVMVIAAWLWRGETYAACEMEQELYRTRFGTTLIAALTPLVAFASSDGSLYKSLIFGAFVCFVLVNSLVSWIGSTKQDNPQVRRAHIITDFMFNEMVAYSSFTMAYEIGE